MRHHLLSGKVGEGIAARHVENWGWKIIARNYQKKWGEIDLIAQERDFLHFIEVKTVLCKNVTDPKERGEHSPEENVHLWKRKRLSRAISSYVLEHDIEEDWFCDMACVYLNIEDRQAYIEVYRDIIL